MAASKPTQTPLPMPLDEVFRQYSVAKLNQYYERIEFCVGKLSEEQLWMRTGKHANAAGNLLLHLTGNVQQWIQTSIDGQEDVRDRDGEFAAREGAEAPELLAALRTVLDGAIAVIESVPTERLMDRITVQGHDVTVLEAIYHVVEHFSGHTGQIIFMTKAFTGEDLGFYRYLAGGGESAADQTP